MYVIFFSKQFYIDWTFFRILTSGLQYSLGHYFDSKVNMAGHVFKYQFSPSEKRSYDFTLQIRNNHDMNNEML